VGRVLLDVLLDLPMMMLPTLLAVGAYSWVCVERIW
jgi:hypothetical protein